jgi:hypothetical protein
LPAPTLLRGVSPRDQEGFTSSNATLRCVLPSLPRRNRLRLSASVLPPPMPPSPRYVWLGSWSLLRIDPPLLAKLDPPCELAS